MILTKKQAADTLSLASADPQRKVRDITAIGKKMVAALALSQRLLDRVHTTCRDSARNLLH